MAEKELKFKSQSFFTGRNGTFKASAISISSASNLGVVRLVPITSKEKLASCEIAIPWMDCKEFIQAFAEIASIEIEIKE